MCIRERQYTSAVADVLATISVFEETDTEAEKQIHALNDLLKENNGSLVRLFDLQFYFLMQLYRDLSAYVFHLHCVCSPFFFLYTTYPCLLYTSRCV